ncbi:flagellin-like protein [Flavimobilis soli]|jgi:flagellin-like protein|uniref:Flagellin-like protein n=1 Tax=Flavimobilis soli TaxID=442709 RepID=A0A2A9EDQ0_9MICO|nr:Flp1 family type IVb pilin [Flavimobilis soli]PFG36382.1 flagellin-like protein [Flavimobilis soli]
MYTFAARAQAWSAQVRDNVKSDRGEVNIVATVLLIVIAVTLVLFFREAIEGWISSLVETIGSGVEDGNSTDMG